MEIIESYFIKDKLYVNTKFISAHLNKTDKQIGRYKKQGMPIAKKPKELNKRGDFYILEEVVEWIDRNVNKTKSSNSSIKKNPNDIDLENAENLFNIYTKGNSTDKKRLLLTLDQNRLDNFKKIEDIIEKEAKNKEYDSKYALVEKVKKGQQELASMFISLLKTSMPVLSKELENKSQDEVYHNLDRHFKKEIDKLRAYITKDEDIIITLDEVIQEVIGAVAHKEVSMEDIVKSIKKIAIK